MFIQSDWLLGLEPIPVRKMLKPAPAVRLNSRSISSRCFVLSDMFVIKLARWKAKLKPNPSIFWKVLERSTLIAPAACRLSRTGSGAPATPWMAAAAVGRMVSVNLMVADKLPVRFKI